VLRKGYIEGIALSNASGESIRKASKIVKISAFGAEIGLFTTDILTNSAIQTCAELDILIHAARKELHACTGCCWLGS
jgi:pyridoxine 4-dehydrogenase